MATIEGVQVDVEPNAINCMDCGKLYMGETTECPENPAEHGYTPTFVSDTPLGLKNDADYWHPRRRRYEYDLDL